MDSFFVFETRSVFLLELFFVLSSKAMPFPDRKWSVLLSFVAFSKLTLELAVALLIIGKLMVEMG